MTTLEHTSSSVARNSTLSDFSFRAIVKGLRHRCREIGGTSRGQSTVISQPQGGDTRFTGRGGLCSQQPAPYRTWPTDDCSPLARALLHELQHFLLEHLPALRVIAEHVEARARGREQYDPVFWRQHVRQANGPFERCCHLHRHRALKRAHNQRRRFSDGNDLSVSHPKRLAQQRKVSALETSTHDHDESAIEALDGPLSSEESSEGKECISGRYT